MLFLFAAMPFPAIADSTSNLTYTTFPLPCRIIDTRLAGGVLTSAAARNFEVSGTSGFNEQGGTAGGCGIPEDAAAVMINLVAVNPSVAGNLRAAALPNSIPSTGSIINYQALSPALNIANGLLFPICSEPLNPCADGDVAIQANGGSTHLVADVLGYFRSFSEVRAFALTQRVSGGATMSGSCGNLGSITMNAPVAGRVVVRGSVVFSVSHFSGGHADSSIASVNADSTTCQGNLGESGRSWIATSSPDGTYYPLINIQRSFTVGPGDHTFYINGAMISGGLQTLHSGGIDLSYYPNQVPPPVTSAQLLNNPDFESGNIGWIADTDVILDPYAYPPQNGSWIAWLNGYGEENTDFVYQDVSIPANATAAQLSFYLWIDSEEAPGTPYDYLYVQIRNSSDVVLETLATYSNLDEGPTYLPRSFALNMASYAGQTIRVYFLGTEDESITTSFLIDDVTLNVTIP